MKAILSFTRSLLFSLLMFAAFTMFLPIEAAAAGGAVVMFATTLNAPQGALFANSLNQEIWLNVIMEMYEQGFNWMDLLEDLSEFVENNTINIAEAGIDPIVLLNNTTYPINVVERVDANHEIPLDYFDTENTVVRNARKVELNYDKMASVLKGHVRALRAFGGRRAHHAIAPGSDSAYTPVIPTTGADNGNAFKLFTEADVLKLAERFDAPDVDAPDEGRVLVLTNQHFNELIGTSDTLKKQRERAKEGTLNRAAYELYGFRIERFYGKDTLYNKGTGVKKAFGAAAAPTTDTVASVAFIQGEVMKAIGDYEMFDQLKAPKERGDIVGFQQRFVAMPKRNKYIGAIYSAAV